MSLTPTQHGKTTGEAKERAEIAQEITVFFFCLLRIQQITKAHTQKNTHYDPGPGGPDDALETFIGLWSGEAPWPQIIQLWPFFGAFAETDNAFVGLHPPTKHTEYSNLRYCFAHQ